MLETILMNGNSANFEWILIGTERVNLSFIEEPIHLQPKQVRKCDLMLRGAHQPAMEVRTYIVLNWVTVNFQFQFGRHFLSFHKCKSAVCQPPSTESSGRGQIVWHRNCFTADLPTNQNAMEIVAPARYNKIMESHWPQSSIRFNCELRLARFPGSSSWSQYTRSNRDIITKFVMN